MGALLIALIPLIQDAVAGDALSAALGSLSITQWVTMAAQLLNAEPQIVAAIKALHPAITTFVTAIENGVDKDVAALGVFDFFANNKPLTIPGYLPDGSVGEIPNPDLKPGE